MAPHLTTFADILRERYDFMSHPADERYPEFDLGQRRGPGTIAKPKNVMLGALEEGDYFEISKNDLSFYGVHGCGSGPYRRSRPEGDLILFADSADQHHNRGASWVLPCHAWVTPVEGPSVYPMEKNVVRNRGAFAAAKKKAVDKAVSEGRFLNDKPVDVPGAYSPPKPQGPQWPEEARPYLKRLERMLSEQVKAGGQDSEYARERVWDRFKVQRQLRKELDRPIPTEERGAGVVALPLDPPLAAYKHRSVRTG